MPNLYPDNIYLQGNLRLTEKRTVRDDARISTRGNSRNPGPTQRPNNSIPLKEWIQEQIDNNEIDIPCTCNNDCILETKADLFKFVDNGLEYQMLDIINNDKVGDSITDLQIVIVDSDLAGNRAIEVITSQFYPYPIIKLTKPIGENEVGNIDEPEEFTYKLIGICNGEEIESEIVMVTIFPVSVNLEEIINEFR